ncbi:MAG: hypothetical protein KJ970_19300 [Candidatus Eisenbacteria bacterium]|uniref:Uncharacterized protein n=1 Tax=Eiseniibacteriota bacterium TaxID=2212470 RepID=A0A948WET9_UNCEI|nr:hypothetical protein [Candidatus Eisenbacteria bacterium]MBU1949732.1 hypothetical protein [Candidatus Eisenbacteria bacterium]MBU2693068.1 hypothetical protein [Candidatus Eisenbacteria bacterium]
MKSVISNTASLAGTVSFDLLGSELGGDVESALQAALEAGVVFPQNNNPLSIFREALATSIRAIEKHNRGPLFQEFLLKGPYEETGPIPPDLIGERLSDTEVASVITFIYSYMVNCFKGAITELLAAKACMHLFQQLRREKKLPAKARLYAGDVVGVHRPKGRGILKGADLYIMIKDPSANTVSDIVVAGVVEVKSYFQSAHRLREQIDQHLRRSKHGLRVNGKDYFNGHVHVGFGSRQKVLRITVLPSDWRLPREFRYETSSRGSLLHVDPGMPNRNDDKIIMTGDDEWRITLRWSKEALAQAAYEMTFWYMGKVGEAIYSRERPKGWKVMSANEAGRNAAKMMLYYAILRCRTPRENQRAIALYNTYGFGYALGMNYRNAKGRREILWTEDLYEIISAGKTNSGCSLS